MDPRLAAIAKQHGGVFRRADALALGYSGSVIRHRLGRSWRTVAPGCYTTAPLGDAAQEHALRVRAGLLRHHDAAAWLQSAALIHDLRGLPPDDGVVRLVRSPATGRRPRRRGWLDVGLARLPAEHLTHHHGVRVTNVPRTVADLLRCLPPHEALGVVDAALHDARTHYAAVLDALDSCGSWPGVVNARRLLDFSDPRAETPLESLSRWQFDVHGLEPPRPQVWVTDARGIGRRVDFYWGRHRTIGEADGLLKYEDSAALRAEKRRQEWLEQAGYPIVRWTWDEILYEPEATIARIRRAFGRAA